MSITTDVNHRLIKIKIRECGGKFLNNQNKCQSSSVKFIFQSRDSMLLLNVFILSLNRIFIKQT